jgi:hypothetical protein
MPQRARRLGIIIRLACYLRAEDRRHEVPPAVFGAERLPRSTPYILTAEQIRQFIDAASRTRPRFARALLTFASKRLKVVPSQLVVEQIDAPLVLDFLNDLETTRGNGTQLPKYPTGCDQILHTLSGISRSVGDRADPAHPGGSGQEN